MTLAHILKGIEAPGYLGGPEPPSVQQWQEMAWEGEDTGAHVVPLGLTLTVHGKMPTRWAHPEKTERRRRP